MGALEQIDKRELKNLLGKGWLTHDAMWFYHCLQDLGIEKTNALNRRAVDSMAAFEVARMKRALGYKDGPVESLADAARFVRSGLELLLADTMKFHFEFDEPDTIHWSWLDGQCFAFKGVTRIGVAGDYRCAVMPRLFGWLTCLGVEYEADPPIEGCLMAQTGSCGGTLRMRLAGQ